MSPVENGIGSKLGLDTSASTSPVTASSSTHETLCSALQRRVTNSCIAMSSPRTTSCPGFPGNAGELAHDPAIGVDLDLAGAGDAAQLDVLRLLDPALADAEIRQFEQRIAVSSFSETAAT